MKYELNTLYVIHSSVIPKRKDYVFENVIKLYLPCVWPPRSNVVNLMFPIDNSSEAKKQTKLVDQ